MSEETEIMPCPFCGELPVITKHFKHEMFGFMHRCPVLGPISRDFREKAQDHIDMWNTRTAQVELVALREELATKNAEIVAMVESALNRSFKLGQIYWQQADSDSTCQQNKSDQTLGTQTQHILNVLKSINDLTKPTESGASE